MSDELNESNLPEANKAKSFNDIIPDPEKQVKEILNDRNPLSLLLDHVADSRNIGGMFRLADAARLSEIIYLGVNENWKPGKLEKRTSRSTINYVPYRGIETMNEIDLQQEAYELLLLEWTDKSTSIWDFKPEPGKKYLLAVGNEEKGVSKELLNTGAPCLHVPMYGINSSMNVTQATAIASYCLLEKMLA